MAIRQFRRFAAMALVVALTWSITPRRSYAEELSPDPARTSVVTGRVLDADGKPVAGGHVVVMAEQWARFERPLGAYLQKGMLRKAHNGLPITFRTTRPILTDKEGCFRIEAPVGSARPALKVLLLAAAEGHGMTTVELAKEKPQQEVTIQLDRERAIRGRLLDTQGQPAAMAHVRPILVVAGFGVTLETLTSNDPPPYGNPLIPAVSTDDKGRFLIRGLGKGNVWIEITGERFATQRMQAESTPIGEMKERPFSLVGAKTVEGRVTYGSGGKAAAGARVVAATGLLNVVQTRVDDEGRYSLNPFPGDSFCLTVFPPEGEPYLPWKRELSFNQGNLLATDVELERGVLVQGRVDEKPSGQPVVEALVLYRARDPESLGTRLMDWIQNPLETAVTCDDGSFELAVPAGAGDLYVIGGTLDYVHVETSVGEREFGRPSLIREYPDAIIPLNIEAGSEPVTVSTSLRRGGTLRARVLGPDGKPAARFLALSRSYIPTGIQLWQIAWNAMQCSDGELILPGCDPAKEGTVHLYDAEHAIGTTVAFTGEQLAGKPLTISLQPCGSATIRFVDRERKPVANHTPSVLIALTPGAVLASVVLTGKDDHALEGDWIDWANFAPKRSLGLRTDADGRLTIPALIPGASYDVHSNQFDRRTGMVKVEFSVKPGESLIVPDFVVDR